jgi:hypothetical protein
VKRTRHKQVASAEAQSWETVWTPVSPMWLRKRRSKGPYVDYQPCPMLTHFHELDIRLAPAAGHVGDTAHVDARFRRESASGLQATSRAHGRCNAPKPINLQHTVGGGRQNHR